MSISNSKRFYWHGVRVTEIVYKQRVAQSKCGKNIAVNRGNCAKRKADKNEKKTEERQGPIQPGEGRRIVELQHLGKQMWCTSCKECLSFEYIDNEQRRGLGSIFLYTMSSMSLNKHHKYGKKTRI